MYITIFIFFFKLLKSSPYLSDVSINVSLYNAFKPILDVFIVIPVDFRPVLRKTMLWEMTGENFAKNLIRYYKIKEQDLLVGHSLPASSPKSLYAISIELISASCSMFAKVSSSPFTIRFTRFWLSVFRCLVANIVTE